MSHLDKLEKTVGILSSVTLEEAEELPPHIIERLSIIATLSIMSGLNTDPISLASMLMQVFILGQRSAIEVPNWEEE